LDYVRLGSSSLKVSRIGLGAMGVGSSRWRSWVLDEVEGAALIEGALAEGINLIDTCNFYSAGASEEIIGTLVERMRIRDDVVIATKVGMPVGSGQNSRGYSRKHIVSAVEGSLRRLRTDRIDLYQTHIWDPETNIEEMMDAFDLLVRQGKVLYLGATDIPCHQLARAVYGARHAGKASFTSVQFHFNAVWREDQRELVPFSRQEGLGLLPYSPAARGFLAGRQRRLTRMTTERARTDAYAWSWYGRPADAEVAALIEDCAARIGAEPAQVALGWVLARLPASVPLVGPTSLSQLRSSVTALDLALDEEDLCAIDGAYAARPSGGHF
jgi:aryl-alcohol dehydrogenase-like predicted oxidoreductase